MLGSVVVFVVHSKSVTHEGPFQFECFHSAFNYVGSRQLLGLEQSEYSECKKKLRGSDIDLS